MYSYFIYQRTWLSKNTFCADGNDQDWEPYLNNCTDRGLNNLCINYFDFLYLLESSYFYYLYSSSEPGAYIDYLLNSLHSVSLLDYYITRFGRVKRLELSGVWGSLPFSTI